MDNLKLIIGTIAVSAALVVGLAYLGGKTANNSDLQERPSDITDNDLIYGNKSAKITIFEYSDIECPYCKVYHETLKNFVSKNDNVKWVFRHFPLAQLHPKAQKEAEAVECVKKIAGVDTAFEYLNMLFDKVESNNKTDLKILNKLASQMNIDKNEFENCLQNRETKDVVDNHAKEALKLGARGTPYSVFVFEDKLVKESGALTEDMLAGIIDNLLKNNKGDK